ncbi:hypothetical protein SSS_00307 [Sarcoptes scabiei]|uniref:Uncharacterized protein n=1 Tax=Sarcoptes scabiei TaxID=52283 RepID=A0A834RHR8_SARSC|nr:hypothetical protein SSS_00307 [Sarcoptes scabiei]
MKLLNRISFDTLTLCLLLISISFDGIRSDDPNGSDLTSESISSHLTVTTLSPSLLNEAISAPLSVDSSDDDHSRSDSIVLKNEITSNNRSSSTSSSSSSSLVQSKQSEVITKKDLEKLATIINLDETKKSKLEILSEKLNKLADRIEKSDGRLKPELLLDEFIPDPLNVRDIKVEKDDWISSYNGHFTNVTMHGIRTLRIESIKVNIAKTNAQIELAISQIFLTGSYKLDGSVSFVDINGAGPFRFNISDMSIEAYGNLQRSPNGKLKIESIEMDINPNEVNLDLENFEVLGSEVIAQTIISTLSEIIFDRVKYTVIEKASIKIQSLINKRLEAIPWETIIKGDSEVIFDDIVAMVGKKSIIVSIRSHCHHSEDNWRQNYSKCFRWRFHSRLWMENYSV